MVGDEEARRRLVERLVALRGAGALSQALVGEAAQAWGVSSRSVWRWVAAAERPAERSCRGHVLNQAERNAVLAWGGNVAAARRALLDQGLAVPSERTLQRAWARDTTPGERAQARDGDAGARARAVYLRHEATCRGEVYEADHKELGIDVLAPRAKRAARPWVTLFVDQFSRLIVGWAISLRPSAAEVLAALRMAVATDSDRGLGGVPGGLRFDNGLEFAARAIEDAALALGCVALRTAPYAPWQKGKVERLNRTIDQELLSGLPRWAGGPRGPDGQLLDTATPLTLQRLVALFATWVDAYNNTRPHQGLGGLTPLARWQEDAAPVPTLESAQLRWMLLAGAARTVNKDGIHFAGHIYVCPELNGLVGERIEVRYMPHDARAIEVYRDGRWLATACPQSQLSAEQRERVLERRAQDARELATATRRARRRARVRYAPLTSAGEPQPTTVLTQRDAADGEEATRREHAAGQQQALRALGLHERLNHPRLRLVDAEVDQ